MERIYKCYKNKNGDIIEYYIYPTENKIVKYINDEEVENFSYEGNYIVKLKEIDKELK